MTGGEFADLQEALLRVFSTILVNASGLAFIACLIGAGISVALQIAHGGRRKKTF